MALKEVSDGPSVTTLMKLEERRREILEEIRRNWWRRISEAQGQGSAQAEPTA
jgi:hypothetical protein